MTTLEIPQTISHVVKHADFDDKKYSISVKLRYPYILSRYPSNTDSLYAHDIAHANKELVDFANGYSVKKCTFVDYFKNMVVRRLSDHVKHARLLRRLAREKRYAEKAGEFACFQAVNAFCIARREEYKKKKMNACIDCPLKCPCNSMKIFNRENVPAITHGPLCLDEAFVEAHLPEWSE